MKLFDFLKKHKTQQDVNMDNSEIIESIEQNYPEIPEKLFIETEHPKTNNMEQVQQIQSNNIHVLYSFLEQNLENKGYEDALMNPDSYHMNQNIENIKNNLGITISKVTTYYSGFIRKIDFHIESRRRNCMVDTVDELIAVKDTAEEEVKIVVQIDQDAKNDTGLCQHLIKSYTRGFRNGLAAITYGTILNRN